MIKEVGQPVRLAMPESDRVGNGFPRERLVRSFLY